MTSRTEERLARLRNRGTLYEIAGMTCDGRTVLVMYSGTSLTRIAHGVRKRYDRLTPILGERIYIARDAEAHGPGCVWITRRTEREAILGGELHYIFDPPLSAGTD